MKSKYQLCGSSSCSCLVMLYFLNKFYAWNVLHYFKYLRTSVYFREMLFSQIYCKYSITASQDETCLEDSFILVSTYCNVVLSRIPSTSDSPRSGRSLVLSVIVTWKQLTITSHKVNEKWEFPFKLICIRINKLCSSFLSNFWRYSDN